MKIEVVKVADLLPDPMNARKHSERNIAAIAASLKVNEMQSPIVIDADGVILKGNGTVEAAKLLGWEKIPAVRSKLTGSAARLYAIADNRTSELAEWDDQVLADTLQALREDDEIDHLATGFDDSEINKLIGGWETDENAIEAEDYDPEKHETYTIKIQKVRHSDKDLVLERVNEALRHEGSGYVAEVF